MEFVARGLFALFAVSACLGAVMVVLTHNVVRMAFWLIVSLGSVACLYFTLHADFVAAAQLLIYVGGTVVVLIFGVMLTASGPYQRIKSSPGETVVAAGIGALFLAMLVSTVLAVDWDANSAKIGPTPRNDAIVHHNPTETGNTTRPLGLALLGTRPDRDLGSDPDDRPAPGYLLPFEIASIHLLVVLIGAAYLARAKRRIAPNDPGRPG
jgi:NADH-quinone oxidoreductase subunit J